MIRRILGFAAVAAALLALGWVWVDLVDPVGETIDEPPTLAPLVAERSLWDASSASGISTVSYATLRDDTAVVIAGKKDGNRLAVLEASTGKTRWSLTNLQKLPGGGGAVYFTAMVGDYTPVVAGPPEDLLVLVPYYRDNCQHPSGWCPRDPNRPHRKEQGVAALSGKDGSVRWMTSVPVDRAEADDLSVSVVAANQHMVVAVTFSTSSGDPTLNRTVALNTSDGRQRWQARDVVAAFLAGDVVVGQVTETHSPFAPGRANPDGPSTVVTLDAADGKRRWDLAEPFTWSRPMLAAGDLIVVRTDETNYRERTRVVEAATGREIAQLGKTSFSCASDGHALIACPRVANVFGADLVTFDLQERRVRISKRQPPEEGIFGVWRGRVFLGDSLRDDPRKQLLADRSANVLNARLPGKLVTISDRYAIFRTTEDADISVHAVTP